LTGRRAFEGAEVSDVLAAVLKDTPPIGALPPEVPPAVRRLLRRTLEKDRAKRLDSMAAARLELDDMDPPAVASIAPASPDSQRRRLVLPAALTGLLAASAAGVVVWRAMQPSPPAIARFAILPSAGAPLGYETNHSDVAITPDGSRVLYFSKVGDQNQ